MIRLGKRVLLWTLGWGCVGLGAVGAVLPGLPTVPFLLVAVWAFARSSPRLRDRLMTHPRYGAALSDWYGHGVIGRRAKTAALAAMAVSVGVTAWIVNNYWIVGLQTGVLAAVGVYVATRPSRRVANRKS